VETIKVEGFDFKPAKDYASIKTGKGYVLSDDVTFATNASMRKSGGVIYSMRLAISASIAKKARLQLGDKIAIYFDKKNMAGMLVRANNSRLTLTGKPGKGRLEVKTTWTPEDNIPTVARTVGCPSEVTDDGILFMLPDCVSFDRNLRAEADAKK
jgi:hypothetical protein